MASLIPIGGGSDTDGWTDMARRACAFDIFHKDGGLLAKRGKVLYHSDFESGELEGWRHHYNGFRPNSAIGLTSYPVRNGRYSMMIGTGAIPRTDNDISNTNSSLKNLSLYRDTGIVSFSGHTCLRSGIGEQAQATNMPGRAWRSLAVAFDIQRWGSATRSFPRVQLIEPTGSDTPQWYIRSDSGSNIVIPNSEGAFSGENENKYNWDYWRFSWDLDANNGLGGYLEFQINNRVFDLRGLGGGSAVQAPQTGAQIDSFSGGFNTAILIERSTKWPEFYPACVFADDLLCTIGDTRA